jgi:hypothetical protein
MEILSAGSAGGTDGGTALGQVALGWACVVVSVVCLALLGRYLQLYTRHVALLARAMDLTEREPLVEAHVRRVLDEVTRPAVATATAPVGRSSGAHAASRRECAPASIGTRLGDLRTWPPDEPDAPGEAVLARWETRRQAAMARAAEYERSREPALRQESGGDQSRREGRRP